MAKECEDCKWNCAKLTKKPCFSCPFNERKGNIKKQLLFVEDGSVDVKELEDKISLHDIPVIVVVYRQGSNIPKLLDLYRGNRKNINIDK